MFEEKKVTSDHLSAAADFAMHLLDRFTIDTAAEVAKEVKRILLTKIDEKIVELHKSIDEHHKFIEGFKKISEDLQKS